MKNYYSINHAMSSVCDQVTQPIQPNQSNSIIFDASDTKFCVGPCVSKEPEALPMIIGDTERHQFKPYSGGKYSVCNYPLSEDCSLIIRNFRVCNSCNKRYLENYDEKDYEQLAVDGNTIRKKLGI